MVSKIGDVIDQEIVAHLCVEYWKLARAALNAVDLINEKASRRLAAQVKYSERQLVVLSEQIGLNIIEFDGEEYFPGISASVDNANEFDEEIELIVTKTLEPAIVSDMKLLRKGRVLVGFKIEK